MATYGVDFYGAAFYGGAAPASYGEDAFTAEARTYTTILLRWVAPENTTWNYVRVMRSRAGFPTHVFEGDEVFYALSNAAGARNPATVPVDPTWPERQNVIDLSDQIEYLDTALSGGWYYYSLFLHNTARNRWERVSITSAMVPYDYNSVDRLWSLIPEFYRTVEDNTAGYSVDLGQINPAIYLSRDRVGDNLTLSKWLSVFGWGMDILRSQADSILDGSDPSRMHMNRLSLLAEQLGSPLENSVSAHHSRSLVRNMSLLYRQRGTENGLEEHLRLATGWDIDVDLGPNMMLSKDAAEFTSPAPEEWNANTRYETNDIVQRQSIYYRAVQNTLGNQPPNATYWSTTPFAESFANRDSEVLSKYGEVSTWSRYNESGYPLPGKTWVGMGVPDPANTALETNALRTYDDGPGGGYDLTGNTKMQLLSVPMSGTDIPGFTSPQGRQNNIETAVPIPVPEPWDATRQYEAGDFVIYYGVPYEATTRTSAVPDSSSQWRQLGYDSRMLMGMSMFVHGPFDGAAGGGVKAKPVVAFFDQHGLELKNSRYVLDPALYVGQIYDSFIGPKPLDTSANNGRQTPIGGVYYTANTGPQWRTGRDVNGSFAFPSGAALSFASFAGSPTNGVVGVTFRSLPTAPREIGLIVRRSDNSNYWAVTNLGIYKVVAGVKSTVQLFTGAGDIKVGDRITVWFRSGGITVTRFRTGTAATGTTLYIGSDTFNNTATKTHGVIAW